MMRKSYNRKEKERNIEKEREWKKTKILRKRKGKKW